MHRVADGYRTWHDAGRSAHPRRSGRRDSGGGDWDAPPDQYVWRRRRQRRHGTRAKKTLTSSGRRRCRGAHSVAAWSGGQVAPTTAGATGGARGRVAADATPVAWRRLQHPRLPQRQRPAGALAPPHRHAAVGAHPTIPRPPPTPRPPPWQRRKAEPRHRVTTVAAAIHTRGRHGKGGCRAEPPRPPCLHGRRRRPPRGLGAGGHRRAGHGARETAAVVDNKITRRYTHSSVRVISRVASVNGKKH